MHGIKRDVANKVKAGEFKNRIFIGLFLSASAKPRALARGLERGGYPTKPWRRRICSRLR